MYKYSRHWAVTTSQSRQTTFQLLKSSSSEAGRWLGLIMFIKQIKISRRYQLKGELICEQTIIIFANCNLKIKSEFVIIISAIFLLNSH